MLNPRLKRETINYCKRRAWLQRNTRELLQECLTEVVNADTFNPVQYNELKRELLNGKQTGFKAVAFDRVF